MKCAMTDECNNPIKYIDIKGFIYCKEHGLVRKSHTSCRQLKPNELKLILANKPLEKY
jgi:hypothetical protein